MTQLLQVRDVSCAKDKDHTIFSKLNFHVNEGDVIILQGKSGAGYVSV
jgi:ABC-type transport system involved in cytochrome c biogenesis ATPase subunit